MSRTIRLLAALAATAALATAAASTAAAAPGMQVGIFDDAQTLYGDPATAFGTLKDLRVQIVRVSLYWGFGPLAVAATKPANPINPDDPAYNWAVYDRAVQYANATGVKVLFSIWGTPNWANGGKGPRAAPTNSTDLQNFAYAAAKRYSGTFLAPDGRLIPPVRYWLAWNEPNNPAFLLPQFVKKKGVWVVQSAIDYAKICTAVYSGVHLTAFAGEQVGCGATSPRGNNGPASSRPSVAPLAFLRAVAKTGPVKFDAWPTTRTTGSRRRSRTRSRRARPTAPARPRSRSATSTPSSPSSTSCSRGSGSGSPSTATRPTRPTPSSACRWPIRRST